MRYRDSDVRRGPLSSIGNAAQGISSGSESGRDSIASTIFVLQEKIKRVEREKIVISSQVTKAEYEMHLHVDREERLGELLLSATIGDSSGGGATAATAAAGKVVAGDDLEPMLSALLRKFRGTDLKREKDEAARGREKAAFEEKIAALQLRERDLIETAKSHSSTADSTTNELTQLRTASGRQIEALEASLAAARNEMREATAAGAAAHAASLTAVRDEMRDELREASAASAATLLASQSLSRDELREASAASAATLRRVSSEHESKTEALRESLSRSESLSPVRDLEAAAAVEELAAVRARSVEEAAQLHIALEKARQEAADAAKFASSPSRRNGRRAKETMAAPTAMVEFYRKQNEQLKVRLREEKEESQKARLATGDSTASELTTASRRQIETLEASLAAARDKLRDASDASDAAQAASLADSEESQKALLAQLEFYKTQVDAVAEEKKDADADADARLHELLAKHATEVGELEARIIDAHAMAEAGIGEARDSAVAAAQREASEASDALIANLKREQREIDQKQRLEAQEAIAKIENASSVVNERLHASEHEVAQQSEQLKHLEEELEAEKVKFAALQSDDTQAHAHEEVLSDEVARLKEKMESTLTSLKIERKKVSGMQFQLDAAGAVVAEKEKEVVAVTAKLDEFEQSVVFSQNEKIEGLEEALEKSNAELHHIEHDRDALNDQIVHLHEEVEAGNARIVEMRTEGREEHHKEEMHERLMKQEEERLKRKLSESVAESNVHRKKASELTLKLRQSEVAATKAREAAETLTEECGKLEVWKSKVQDLEKELHENAHEVEVAKSHCLHVEDELMEKTKQFQALKRDSQEEHVKDELHENMHKREEARLRQKLSETIEKLTAFRKEASGLTLKLRKSTSLIAVSEEEVRSLTEKMSRIIPEFEALKVFSHSIEHERDVLNDRIGHADEEMEELRGRIVQMRSEGLQKHEREAMHAKDQEEEEAKLKIKLSASIALCEEHQKTASTLVLKLAQVKESSEAQEMEHIAMRRARDKAAAALSGVKEAMHVCEHDRNVLSDRVSHLQEELSESHQRVAVLRTKSITQHEKDALTHESDHAELLVIEAKLEAAKHDTETEHAHMLQLEAERVALSQKMQSSVASAKLAAKQEKLSLSLKYKHTEAELIQKHELATAALKMERDTAFATLEPLRQKLATAQEQGDALQTRVLTMADELDNARHGKQLHESLQRETEERLTAQLEEVASENAAHKSTILQLKSEALSLGRAMHAAEDAQHALEHANQMMENRLEHLKEELEHKHASLIEMRSDGMASHEKEALHERLHERDEKRLQKKLEDAVKERGLFELKAKKLQREREKLRLQVRELQREVERMEHRLESTRHERSMMERSSSISSEGGSSTGITSPKSSKKMKRRSTMMKKKKKKKKKKTTTTNTSSWIDIPSDALSALDSDAVDIDDHSDGDDQSISPVRRKKRKTTTTKKRRNAMLVKEKKKNVAVVGGRKKKKKKKMMMKKKKKIIAKKPPTSTTPTKKKMKKKMKTKKIVSKPKVGSTVISARSSTRRSQKTPSTTMMSSSARKKKKKKKKKMSNQTPSLRRRSPKKRKLKRGKVMKKTPNLKKRMTTKSSPHASLRGSLSESMRSSHSRRSPVGRRSARRSPLYSATPPRHRGHSGRNGRTPPRWSSELRGRSITNEVPWSNEKPRNFRSPPFNHDFLSSAYFDVDCVCGAAERGLETRCQECYDRRRSMKVEMEAAIRRAEREDVQRLPLAQQFSPGNRYDESDEEELRPAWVTGVPQESPPRMTSAQAQQLARVRSYANSVGAVPPPPPLPLPSAPQPRSVATLPLPSGGPIVLHAGLVTDRHSPLGRDGGSILLVSDDRPRGVGRSYQHPRPAPAAAAAAAAASRAPVDGMLSQAYAAASIRTVRGGNGSSSHRVSGQPGSLDGLFANAVGLASGGGESGGGGGGGAGGVRGRAIDRRGGAPRVALGGAMRRASGGGGGSGDSSAGASLRRGK